MSEIDGIFNEFARLFVGTVDDDKDVACPSQLRRPLLDGSLASLHHVDDYLAYLHEHRDAFTPEEWRLTVLRAGAYVGEVIRHASPSGSFEWVDYNDYMPQHPELRSVIPDRNTATCAFLVRSSGAMSMPLNKIARFIEEGREHSVHFFASCDLKDFQKRWWQVWK
jgi:hypothetical protein